MNKTGIEVERVLREKWNETVPENTELRYRIVFPNHPQDWYLGWDSKGHKTLVFSSPYSANINSSFSTTMLFIKETVKKNGTYNLSFSLVNDSYFEIFLKLCDDLIVQSQRITSKEDALKLVFARFHMWKSMFQNKPSLKVVYQGVLGELLMVKYLVEKGMDPCDVLHAWTGPEFTEQDFVFPSEWYEVKAISSEAMTIQISSAGQLDHPGKGGLYVFVLDSCMENIVDAITPKKVCEEIEKKLFSYNQGAMELFENRLTTFEYYLTCIDEPYWFKYISIDKYIVKDDFPRLTHSIKRPEMKAITYSLNRVALEPWRQQNE